MKIDLDRLPALVREHLKFFQLNRAAEARLGLSIIQYQVLRVVKSRPGMSPQVLARELGAHPSSLTQSLKRLEKKEALFIGEHPHDARKKVISLTRSGNELLTQFESGWGLLNPDS